MSRVLLLQVGHTFDEIAAVRGDYDRWFRDGLGVSEDELEVLRVYDGAPLPAQFNYDGIVVTGSWSMVTDREPWSEATAEYLRAAAELERPILGVCYGHQLLAHAFGGLVGYNPVGRNVGTARVDLTDAAASDPLFQDFKTSLHVHVSHSQRVIDLPAEAVLLGTCDRDPHHAFRIGPSAWGVQFHPEFSAPIAREYIRIRYETILAEGLDADALLATVSDSADGEKLLKRFRALIS
ncbi:MAG TPA: glutamine amidotransferase [Polyangiales bacterium]|nr:glutamine amidotransferase [Polyangiales bacterium]